LCVPPSSSYPALCFFLSFAFSPSFSFPFFFSFPFYSVLFFLLVRSPRRSTNSTPPRPHQAIATSAPRHRNASASSASAESPLPASAPSSPTSHRRARVPCLRAAGAHEARSARAPSLDPHPGHARGRSRPRVLRTGGRYRAMSPPQRHDVYCNTSCSARALPENGQPRSL
jgi:hypothetical protein